MHVTSEYVGDVDSNDLFQKAKTEHYFRMAEEFFRMARYGAAQDALARVFALDATSRQASSLKKKIARAQKEIALLANPSSNGHARSAKRGELVLVVDQDERVLSSLVATLQRYGFTPTGAASFEEAIDVLTSYKPNLILSEVNFQNGPVGFDLYYGFATIRP